MPYYTSPSDGANLFYRDYVPASHPEAFRPISEKQELAGSRPTFVFLHGWPMNSLMYEQLMLPLCETHRYRCIAPDRRGFGHSDWRGFSENPQDIAYETFADDTIHLLEKLKIRSIVFVAASMGCGETVLAFHRSQYVQIHCKGFIWMGPSLPYPLATPDNPTAPSREVWDSILDGMRNDRPGFTHIALPGVFGVSAGVKVGEQALERFKRIVEMADAQAMERCTQIITSYNFTHLLAHLGQKSNIPIMVLHGDCDQGMPFEASTKLIEQLITRTEVKTYRLAAHGLYLTHAQQVMKDLLAFVHRDHSLGPSRIPL